MLIRQRNCTVKFENDNHKTIESSDYLLRVFTNFFKDLEPFSGKFDTSLDSEKITPKEFGIINSWMENHLLINEASYEPFKPFLESFDLSSPALHKELSKMLFASEYLGLNQRFRQDLLSFLSVRSSPEADV
jgi:hypothetical protein